MNYTKPGQGITHYQAEEETIVERAPGRNPDQLEYMLGNLQADMSRQGVNTVQKGSCSACDKPIVGQVITALGKTWHPEHFTCNHCNQELGTRNCMCAINETRERTLITNFSLLLIVFEREGMPYCEPDYHNLFSPRCAYCNGPILDVKQHITTFKLSKFTKKKTFFFPHINHRNV